MNVVVVSKGCRVRVNVAPFIASVMRCDETIPCEVLDVDGGQVLVRTEPPYRRIALWVVSTWIDVPLQPEQATPCPSAGSSSGKSMHGKPGRTSVRA